MELEDNPVANVRLDIRGVEGEDTRTANNNLDVLSSSRCRGGGRGASRGGSSTSGGGLEGLELTRARVDREHHALRPAVRAAEAPDGLARIGHSELCGLESVNNIIGNGDAR